MTEIIFETYWPKKYNGEYIGGWARCPLHIPNVYIKHWFFHVHYFTCIIGGKQFIYIKDNQEELTSGTGTWYGFNDCLKPKGWCG